MNQVTDQNNFGIKEDAQNFNFIMIRALRHVPNEVLENIFNKLDEDKKRLAVQLANDVIGGVDWAPAQNDYRNVKYLMDRVQVAIKSKPQ